MQLFQRQQVSLRTNEAVIIIMKVFALAYTIDLKYLGQTKHIEIRYHYI